MMISGNESSTGASQNRNQVLGISEKHGKNALPSPEPDFVLGEEAQSYSPEDEARVLRKIDTFFMPAMVIGR